MTAMDGRGGLANAAPAAATAGAKSGAASPPSPEKGKFAAREKIYPKLGRGTFRNVKWAMMAFTLGVYYLLPWLRWNRAPGLPNQAFLLDFEHQRLFFGPLELWAQEFYFVTGILIISALGLFLVTSIAGRVWCGYACPQTVWTDLMITVERFWQGDRNARLRLDQQPWTFEKIWKKTATHITWLLIGVATGGALVFYFRDAPTLAHEFLTGTAPTVAYVFLGIFAFTTYLLGGIAREQVCIYMCPWPRIQGAMLDHDSLFISYREARGEPRGPHKKGETWEGRGDCVDCTACVTVCPMGIDIRDGAQLECIQCGLCIDACNSIMDKVGRPRALIAYTTQNNLDKATAGPRDGLRLLRPRTMLYGAVISLVLGIMTWALISRSDMTVSVLPARNPLFVALSDGGIRNAYTVKIVNKLETPRNVKVRITGLEGATLSFADFDGADPTIEIGPSAVRAVKMFVSVPAERRRSLTSSSVSFDVVVADQASNAETSRASNFRSPER